MNCAKKPRRAAAGDNYSFAHEFQRGQSAGPRSLLVFANRQKRRVLELLIEAPGHRRR
jgi:hypothetical protein